MRGEVDLVFASFVFQQTKKDFVDLRSSSVGQCEL